MKTTIMKTTIIYEDKDILIIQKPVGLATQTGKIGQQDVVSELKNYLASGGIKGSVPVVAQKAQGNAGNHKTDIYLGIIHRLDQPVEGLLVFAKNKAAAGALTKQLAGGTLHKQYYAVICGQPSPKEGQLVDYLVKEDNLARVVTGQQGQYPDAKRAVLRYGILQEISTPESLVLADIHIDTGRFHQIRAQMAHAGMPLVGDAKYANAQATEVGRRLGIRNVALCAYCLELKHPSTGKLLKFRIKPEGKAFSYFDYFDNPAASGKLDSLDE